MPARWPAGLDSRRLPEPLVVLLLSAFSISDPISQIGEFSSLSRYIFLYFDNTLGRTQKYRVLRQSCWVSLLYSSYQIGQNLHHSSMNVRGHWRWSVWTEIPVEILVQRSIKVCCHKTGSHVTHDPVAHIWMAFKDWRVSGSAISSLIQLRLLIDLVLDLHRGCDLFWGQLCPFFYFCFPPHYHQDPWI